MKPNKPIINLNDSESKSYFPEIKSIKSPSNSPKQHFSGTPIKGLASLNNASKHFGFEELVITKLNEKSQKEKQTKTKKTSETSALKQKYIELIKFLKEREEYICQLESRMNDNDKEADLTESTKGQIYSHRKKSNKNISKNGEILALKQENHDLIKSFEKASKQISDLSQKVSTLDQAKQKLLYKSEQLEKNLQQKLSETENLQKKLKETQTELESKLDELEDTSRLLQISEDKRRVAIEQTMNTEKKFFNIKLKNNEIITNQTELKTSLDDLTREILLKESEVRHLTEEIFVYQRKLEKEQDLNSTLRTELEMVKLMNKNNLEFWQTQLEEMEKENKELKESVADRSQHVRRNSRRTETVIKNRFLDNFNAQEVARWQQKYFETEEKLMNKTMELEKFKKDGVYLHSQLEGKNELIDRLNKIIQDNIGETSSSQRFSSLHIEGLYEVQELIDKLTKQNMSLLENFQCSTCTSQQNLQQNFPCTHLQCSNCQQNLNDLCSFCSKKVEFSTESSQSTSILSHLKSQNTSFKHLKLLINTFSF